MTPNSMFSPQWLLMCMIICSTAYGLPKDDPITPAQAVSMLQEGLVWEWRPSEDGLQNYDARQIKAAKDAGFHHIRIRNHWKSQTEELALDQPYNEKLVGDLERLIDDVLAQGLGAVIAFRGSGPMGESKAGATDRTATKKYVRFWTMLAERFQNKSHRLFFNLFIEPGSLKGRNGEIYAALTKAIRKTNPTRIIVYYKTPGAESKGEDGERDSSLPGPKYYAKSAGVLPKEAGRYFIWDYHVLKHDVIANQWKVKQAYQYMQYTKEVMWSGAWSRLVGKENFQNKLAASAIAEALRNYGMPSAILSCGSNSFYNRETNEWADPEMVASLTRGPSIWWNMLDNPGFDQGKAPWECAGEVTTVGGIQESPHLQVDCAAGPEISQDVTLALYRNGPGQYDVLGHFTGAAAYSVQFSIKTPAKTFTVAPKPMSAGKWTYARARIPVAWTGELTNAKLVIRCSGAGEVGIDKLGFTQFYREPVFDLAHWPGEVDRSYKAPAGKKASKSLKLKNRIRIQIESGNAVFVAIDKQIQELRKQIAVNMTKIYPQYQWPHESNPKQLQLLVENRSRKHSSTKPLMEKIKALELKYRDWFIIHDKAYREEFVRVYGGIPPHLQGVTFSDTNLTVMKDARDALKAKKKARKKSKSKGPKLTTIEAPLVRLTATEVVVKAKKEEKTFAIDKGTRILNYDGKPIALAQAKFTTVRVAATDAAPDKAVEVRDVTIAGRKAKKKDKKKKKKSKGAADNE